MSQPVASAESRQRTAALLIDLWQRNLPLIEHRLAVLERAAARPGSEASPEGLPEELRVEAANVAHKLAGSLGMFGFERGTEIAREIELVLESGRDPKSETRLESHPGTLPPDLFRLEMLTNQLRSILFPRT